MSLTWPTVPEQSEPAAFTVPKGFGKGSSIHTEQNYGLFTFVLHIELKPSRRERS